MPQALHEVGAEGLVERGPCRERAGERTQGPRLRAPRTAEAHELDDVATAAARFVDGGSEQGFQCLLVAFIAQHDVGDA